MHGTGDDYIFFNNQCGIITCPESFAIEFSDRHKEGIGGDGIVLIEESENADAKMRIFNIDGSEGKKWQEIQSAALENSFMIMIW